MWFRTTTTVWSKTQMTKLLSTTSRPTRLPSNFLKSSSSSPRCSPWSASSFSECLFTSNYIANPWIKTYRASFLPFIVSSFGGTYFNLCSTSYSASWEPFSSPSSSTCSPFSSFTFPRPCFPFWKPSGCAGFSSWVFSPCYLSYWTPIAILALNYSPLASRKTWPSIKSTISTSKSTCATRQLTVF